MYRQVVYVNDDTEEVVLVPPGGSEVVSHDSARKRTGSRSEETTSSTYYDADMGMEVKSVSRRGSIDYTSFSIDYWDTAGQEVFTALHPSYYYGTSCCILCFDVTRKITYTHLTDWYNEYNSYCSKSGSLPPVILVANKIDVDYNVTKKEFKFASRHNLPFFFVSAADGTNVVKVFHQAIKEAINYKNSGNDVLSDVLAMLKTTTIPKEIECKQDSEAVSAFLSISAICIHCFYF